MSDVSFNTRLTERNLSPLWEQFAALVPPQPNVAARPAHWRYADVRPLLIAAPEHISAEDAERRVLVLENPGLGRSARVADTLYAGLQIILPGERAPSHRHSQSALRFVVEGSGAYTTVEGERTDMERGDFIITPSWTWHEHANAGTGPVIWLDGLDVPIVASLTGGFFERSASETGGAHGNAREGNTKEANTKGSSRIINFRYRDTRATLAALARTTRPDPLEGYVVRYGTLQGDWALPTLAAQLLLLPRGFDTQPLRTTASRVFFAAEGRGVSRIDASDIHWEENDVMIAPAWSAISHQPGTQAVLFEFSDRAAQEKLGLYREERDR